VPQLLIENVVLCWIASIVLPDTLNSFGGESPGSRARSASASSSALSSLTSHRSLWASFPNGPYRPSNSLTAPARFLLVIFGRRSRRRCLDFTLSTEHVCSNDLKLARHNPRERGDKLFLIAPVVGVSAAYLNEYASRSSRYSRPNAEPLAGLTIHAQRFTERRLNR
jgi:hypothetical protein